MSTFYDTGAYVGTVVDQALGEGQGDKKTPYFMLKVKINGTPNGDGTFTKVNREYERSVYFYLTEKTVGFVTENLANIGFTGKMAQLDPDHAQAHIFKGQQVDLYCQHEEYDGDWKERWSLSRVLEVKKLEPKKLRQLDSLFSKAMKDTTPVLAKGKAMPEDEDQRRPSQVDDINDVGITDDDIPF